MRWLLILLQRRGRFTKQQLFSFTLFLAITAYLHGPRGCLTAIAWGAAPETSEAHQSPPIYETRTQDEGSEISLSKETQLLEVLLACEENFGASTDLVALQEGLAAQSVEEDRELARAFLRARRSARLPEVLRFQSGARFDRDRENRARLTQDFDALGDMHRSSFEDRDTFQNDLYVDVRVSADWRLARTRWSNDEVALRRERSNLRAYQATRRQELVNHWFGLQHAHNAWCEARERPLDTSLTMAQQRKEAQKVETLRLQLWQHLSALNSLTDGWFVETLTSTLSAPRRRDESSPYARRAED